MWPGDVLTAPGFSDLRVGTFLFTIDGHFVGLVAQGSAGVVVVPAASLSRVVDELTHAGAGSS
jgi:hypothetical protein